MSHSRKDAPCTWAASCRSESRFGDAIAAFAVEKGLAHSWNPHLLMHLLELRDGLKVHLCLNPDGGASCDYHTDGAPNDKIRGEVRQRAGDRPAPRCTLGGGAGGASAGPADVIEVRGRCIQARPAGDGILPGSAEAERCPLRSQG